MMWSKSVLFTGDVFSYFNYLTGHFHILQTNHFQVRWFRAHTWFNICRIYNHLQNKRDTRALPPSLMLVSEGKHHFRALH